MTFSMKDSTLKYCQGEKETGKYSILKLSIEKTNCKGINSKKDEESKTTKYVK